jgi:aldehyde oxidoreductase
VVENEYYTPFVEHAYLEPEACLAEPDGAGGVRVHIGSQGPNVDRKQVAESLGLPMERVRVIHTPMGGGFGGKEDITVQILAALGAMLTGRPVKMVLPRSESMRISTKRHAMYMRYKSGVSADGRLVAVQARIVGDTGAYGSVGSAVLFRAATFGCGPYVVPNVCVDSYAVYTNNPPCGAMRGFGSPQVAFAADCQMDEIARRLGMDPFEVRLRNALEPGSITATGHRVVESVGVKDCLLAVRRELAREALPEPSAGRRLGVGISAAYKNVGLGPGVEDQAGARMELTPAGKVVVRCGCVDMGQGHDTAMAQIASRTLQVPYCDIMVVTGDTESCPDSYMTTASRATLLQGRAVQMAAERLRECVLDYAVSQYDFRREKSRWLGDVVRDESTGSSVALRELAAKAAGQGYALQAEAYYRAPKAYYNFVFDEERFAEDPEQYRVHVAYCFCAQACVVEVDEATGEVKVLRIIAAQDVGTPIHPQNLQGQMEGGVVMGMGYGLTEEFMVRDGYVVSDTLRKSKIPRITDAPAITTLIVENPHSLGPYGAKGMAELSLTSTAPAIANGVFDAVGVRVRQLPLTRERVLAALQQSGPGVSAH